MLKKLLEEISNVPSVSFLTRPITDYIIKKVHGFSIDDCRLESDEFGIYIQLRKGVPRNKFFIISHLDHPGFVVENETTAIPFGDIGNHLIQKLLEKNPVPVLFFDPRGYPLCKGKIVSYEYKDNSPRVIFESELSVPKNSFGQFDLCRFEEAGGVVKMYHADNNALTACALMSLYNLRNVKDIDVEFIFTHSEEVRQLGSFGIASRRKTPFGQIRLTDILINLEITTFLESETGREEGWADIKEKSLELGLPQLNYTNGCIIRVNDTYTTYGVFFPDSENSAEIILRTQSESLGIPYQSGIALGLTDAQSFSLFPITPNIATLCMPSKYRHNWNDANNLVPEQFNTKDAENIIKIIEAVCSFQNHINTTKESLTRKLKISEYKTDTVVAMQERKKRLRRLNALLPRMKRGYYVPENIIDRIVFFLYQVKSKL